MTTDRLIPLVAEPAAAPRSRPLWPRIRRAIFWTHLAAGCVAGLVILLLAVTGVLLTYERQIMGALEAASWSSPAAGAERRSIDALVADVTREDFQPAQVALRADPAAPVQISAGRRNRIEVDPYTGLEVAPAAPKADAFFSFVTRLHRWFALEDEARKTAKQVTGAANLIFLFILLSGIVIWLPPIWKRALLATQLLFSRRYPSAKARDYNWHHVIGVWCLVPLFVISATGTVFNYDWARDTLRWLSGAEAVAETGAPGGARGQGQNRGQNQSAGRAGGRNGGGENLSGAQSLDALLATASAQSEGWTRLTLAIPKGPARAAEVTVDRGNGAQIQHQEIMRLDRRSAEVLSRAPRNGDDPAAYARSVNRFLHTGEIFGLGGQTLAGLASLGCALLVWTGLALAFRRLVLAPLRRRRAMAERPQGQAATA